MKPLNSPAAPTAIAPNPQSRRSTTRNPHVESDAALKPSDSAHHATAPTPERMARDASDDPEHHGGHGLVVGRTTKCDETTVYVSVHLGR